MVVKYMPILKDKKGEFEALMNLSIIQRSGVVPLIDLIPRNPDEFRGAKENFDRVVKAIQTPGSYL